LRRDHDVFNALDILENKIFLKNLKFGPGDGKLRYYFFNWRMEVELDPSDVGLVLL
jgi:glycylpeptide N-tetradecanoyltransferase